MVGNLCLRTESNISSQFCGVFVEIKTRDLGTHCSCIKCENWMQKGRVSRGAWIAFLLEKSEAMPPPFYAEKIQRGRYRIA